MREALLLIDLQNGFVSDKTEHVVPRIEQLLALPFDSIIATKFVNQEGSPYDRLMGWRGMMSSPDTDLLPIAEEKADYILEKNLYTAVDSRLLALLEQESIDLVCIAGIDTDCCVLKNAEDLFEKGIDCRVLLDYTASNGGPESERAAAKVLSRSVGERCLVHGEIDTLPE